MIRRALGHLFNPQFVRYVITGAWNTAFGYAVYAGLTYVLTPHVPYAYMVAGALGSVIAITMAYISYKLFVFKTRGNILREYGRFYIVYGAAALINLVLLPFAVKLAEYLPVRNELAPYLGGAALMGITVIISFFSHRNFSFHASRKKNG